MPRLIRSKLKPGDRVHHKRFGNGVVLRPWGSWFDREVGGDGYVNGNEIYDVRFGLDVQFVHQSRLT